jgi:chemotaxis protein MotA
MDKASVIGLLIGVFCIGTVLYEVSEGHLMAFYSLEGILTVGGGSISVLFMAMPLEKLKDVGGYLRQFFLHKSRNAVEVVELITKMANTARRDGILALDAHIAEVETDDPFLASGLRMAVDGTDPECIESTLRFEIMAMQERHKAGKKLFDLLKLYSPGWALVGTLIGQIGMFANLEGAEVGKLGKMLAIAVCATMYGCVVANALAGPIGDKLALRSSEEIQNREMVLQGILSIQAGDNPRITLEKLTAFIAFGSRGALKRLDTGAAG